MGSEGEESTEKNADKNPKADVKVEGRVAAGFEAEEFKRGRSRHEAELDFETKRRKGTRAVASVKGKSGEQSVYLEDAYIDHKFDDDDRLVFGQTRKHLGLQYSRPDRERHTVRRSPIYRKMEEFGFVGRELTLRYAAEDDPEKGEGGFAISGGYSESLDFNSILHYRQPLADGRLYAGAWALGQSDRIDAGRQVVYAAVFSLWTEGMNHTAEWEAFFGKDPFESEFEKVLGDGKPVHFASTRLLYGYKFDGDEGRVIHPVFESGVIWHDLDYPKYNTLQALLGSNLYLSEALRIAGNIEMLGTNSRIEPRTRAWNESNVQFEVTYYF